MSEGDFEGRPEKDPMRRVEFEPEFDSVAVVGWFPKNTTGKHSQSLVLHRGQIALFSPRGEVVICNPLEPQNTEVLDVAEAFCSVSGVNGDVLAGNNNTEILLTGKGVKAETFSAQNNFYWVAWGKDTTNAMQNLHRLTASYLKVIRTGGR